MIVESGLTEPMKLQLKQYLQQVMTEVDEMIHKIDHKDCCILSDFEQIHHIFSELQKTAASHYLNAYLSPFTDRYQDLSTAIQHFSERKHGALIAIQRQDTLTSFIHSGTPIGATATHALLESIFYPGSPLHDGAVLIKTNEIVSAGNILPLSKQDVRDRKFGTRHRAAIGLSERSDALVLVVSEETGRASFALEGELYSIQPGGLI